MKSINFDTYSEMIDEVLDYIDTKENVTVFCDYELAKEIYEMIDEDDYEEVMVELDESIDEYYIGTVGNKLFCIEYARCQSGEYEGRLKLAECDYAIVINNAVEDSAELEDKLYGEFETVILDYDIYDLHDEECTGLDNCDECDCCECDLCDYEVDDSFEEEIRIISECVEDILNAKCCPDCTVNAVIEICDKFKNIGRENAKAEMQRLLDIM
jgi:hypothetical protein